MFECPLVTTKTFAFERWLWCKWGFLKIWQLGRWYIYCHAWKLHPIIYHWRSPPPHTQAQTFPIHDLHTIKAPRLHRGHSRNIEASLIETPKFNLWHKWQAPRMLYLPLLIIECPFNAVYLKSVLLPNKSIGFIKSIHHRPIKTFSRFFRVSNAFAKAVTLLLRSLAYSCVVGFA